MSLTQEAYTLLKEFKGDRCVYGAGVLNTVGAVARTQGKRVAFVRDTFPGSKEFIATIRRSLGEAGLAIVAEIEGAGPNGPREELTRITGSDPDVLISFGGGSTIDAIKAAEVLRTLGGDIEDYFGTGLVTQALKNQGKRLTPHVAIQTAASSGAHLTTYSNITDISTSQKKLIVDEAIVPTHPMFDFAVTYNAPQGLTMDGALERDRPLSRGAVRCHGESLIRDDQEGSVR